MKKPLSLTLRLFLSVVALNFIVLCIVSLLGLESVSRVINESSDAQLITESNILWQVVHDDITKGDINDLDIVGETPLLEKNHLEALEEYARWHAFRIWKSGAIVIRDDKMSDLPAVPSPSGFSNITLDNETWRVFALYVPDENMVVESFENISNRSLLGRDMLGGVLVPLFFMLPLLAWLFSIGIKFGLSSLYRLAHRLEARSPTDLSRLESGDIPKELKPLTHAVNTLLGKLEQSLLHEREFIDHAAHELRTPLSALKLQAQLLVKSMSDPSQKSSVEELLLGVDRTSKLIDQLLLLSRITHQDIGLVPVCLLSAVKEVLRLHGGAIVDKHIRLTLPGETEIEVLAHPELLRILIGTIVDNAVKYTPQDGEIMIGIVSMEGNIRLTITDSGEGIPEAEQSRVFDRFYRAANAKQSGSGLGLAIARQIAELVGIAIHLATPRSGKGIEVVIVLPMAAADTGANNYTALRPSAASTGSGGENK